MSWDACQREVLEALGHRVYAHVPVSVDAQPAVATDASVGASPVLLRALARAAGMSDAAWRASGVLLDATTPAAKRALWPRLRAMRRNAQSQP